MIFFLSFRYWRGFLHQNPFEFDSGSHVKFANSTKRNRTCEMLFRFQLQLKLYHNCVNSAEFPQQTEMKKIFEK